MLDQPMQPDPQEPRDSYGVPRTARELELERALIESLWKIGADVRRYARLHREAHRDATLAQCFRPAIFAALRAAEPEHHYWGILTERTQRVAAALQSIQRWMP